MNDITIVEKILRSLTPKYDYVVSSIEESIDIDELSLDELQSSLLVHEQKMNRNSTFDEQALKESTFISSNCRGRGRGIGRGRGDRGNRDGGNKYGNGNFRANDDYDKGCLMRRKKSQILLRIRKETLLMAVHAENEPEEQTIWYVDTGCSNHMTGSKSSFTDINENFRSTASFGDLSTVNMMGKVNIKIRTKNRCVEIISNVFYVPAL
ncbi:uncharacterized protein LOC125829129 [Solanum verrucosum]|uniref:uncharacterized protein LOC125829129 n=1 Tax=Solanum verrucosum TaxID=315347 RepID=UPI0020D0D046|nr:uncharacterized protein LOC125829129 [Solanum verrucosum]